MNNKAKIKTKCPQCKKKTAWEGNKWRPFCSERCKTLDLGAWASENYKIESLEDEFIEDAQEIDSKKGEYH